MKGDPEQLKTFLKAHRGHQVFYADFKDTNLLQQSTLMLIIARDVLQSVIWITLFEYPFLQAALFLISSTTMILYFVMEKPFKSRFEELQQYFYEAVMFIVFVGVMISAIMNGLHSSQISE